MKKSLEEIQNMNISQREKDLLFSDQFEHLSANLGYYNICEGSEDDLYVRFLSMNSYQRFVMRVDWEKGEFAFTDFRYSFDDIDNDFDPIESRTYFFSCSKDMISFAESYKQASSIEEYIISAFNKDVLIDVAEEGVIRAFKGDICFYIVLGSSNEENHLLQIFVDPISKEDPIFEIRLKTISDVYNILKHNKFVSLFDNSHWIADESPIYSAVLLLLS